MLTVERCVCVAVLTCTVILPGQADPQEVDRLRVRVATLELQLRELLSNRTGVELGTPRDAQVEQLTSKVQELESRLAAKDGAAAAVELEEVTDGFAQGLPTRDIKGSWQDRIDLWGFGAFGFLATGEAGTRKHGGFLVKESTLFVEADIFDEISLFFELQVNRLAKDDSLFVRTGEVYAHFRYIFGAPNESYLSAKVGRFDIPFGEEYLYQDAVDNPLISQSAAYPYGWDEGLLLYGKVGGVGWVASISDGTDARSIDDDIDQAVNLKLFGQATDWLYVSASFMRQPRSEKSALEFGGSHFQPVGASHPSVLGTSGSSKVDALLYELDARISFEGGHYLALVFGQAFADDKIDRFDRDFLWFSFEGYIQLSAEVYAVARYSEIGTYDRSAGYHFDGKILAGGNSALGYDVRRLQRLSLGLGWKPHPGLILKIEGGRDWFDLIDASDLRARNSQRWFAGIEAVVSF